MAIFYQVVAKTITCVVQLLGEMFQITTIKVLESFEKYFLPSVVDGVLKVCASDEKCAVFIAEADKTNYNGM